MHHVVMRRPMQRDSGVRRAPALRSETSSPERRHPVHDYIAAFGFVDAGARSTIMVRALRRSLHSPATSDGADPELRILRHTAEVLDELVQEHLRLEPTTVATRPAECYGAAPRLALALSPAIRRSIERRLARPAGPSVPVLSAAREPVPIVPAEAPREMPIQKLRMPALRHRLVRRFALLRLELARLVRGLAAPAESIRQ